MRWFRTKRTGIGWLACFALACQLVVSFGHVHLGSGSGNSIGVALADAGGKGSAAAPFSPSQKHPGGLAEFCAICAVVSLAGTLVVPGSPAVVAPVPFIHELAWSLAAVEPAAFDYLPFSARGPPQA